MVLPSMVGVSIETSPLGLGSIWSETMLEIINEALSRLSIPTIIPSSLTPTYIVPSQVFKKATISLTMVPLLGFSFNSVCWSSLKIMFITLLSFLKFYHEAACFSRELIDSFLIGSRKYYDVDILFFENI